SKLQRLDVDAMELPLIVRRVCTKSTKRLPRKLCKRSVSRFTAFESLEHRELLSATDIRIVTYNVHSTGNSCGRGNGLPSPDLGTVLEAIGDETAGDGIAQIGRAHV